MAVEISVKLACKQIFTAIFSSEESPMILVRSKNVQEYAPLNSYNLEIIHIDCRTGRSIFHIASAFFMSNFVYCAKLTLLYTGIYCILV